MHRVRPSPHWRRCGGRRFRTEGGHMANDASTPQSATLAGICSDTRAAVARAKARTSLETLRHEIGVRDDTPRSFGSALKEAVAQGRYGLIAEIKKASPSGGLIRC